MKNLFIHPKSFDIQAVLDKQTAEKFIFQNDRFAYLDKSESNSYSTILLPKEFVFLTEKLFFQSIKTQNNPFVYFYDYNQPIDDMKDFLKDFPLEDKENSQINYPDELYLLQNTWEKGPSNIISELTPGFIHNISSPITALSGRAELAKMTGKNLIEDKNFFEINKKLTSEIRLIQWFLESLDYKAKQKFTMVHSIEKLIDIAKGDLIFKHKIKSDFIYDGLENISVFTSLFFFNILILNILKVFSLKTNKKTSFQLTIKLENRINKIIIDFITPQEINFRYDERIQSKNSIHHLIWQYLQWSYLIPFDIEIIEENHIDKSSLKVVFPI